MSHVVDFRRHNVPNMLIDSIPACDGMHFLMTFVWVDKDRSLIQLEAKVLDFFPERLSNSVVPCRKVEHHKSPLMIPAAGCIDREICNGIFSQF